VGVSTSCGSLWFLHGRGVIISERGPNSARFLDQDERIAIADGLHAHVPVPLIAESLGRTFQTVYREIERNSKPDGTYQPF
jgi:transposase, IS30 family